MHGTIKPDPVTGKPVVTCQDGYGGPDCAKPVKICPGTSKCSGHGVCTDEGCACYQGWSGADCASKMNAMQCPLGFKPAAGASGPPTAAEVAAALANAAASGAGSGSASGAGSGSASGAGSGSASGAGSGSASGAGSGSASGAGSGSASGAGSGSASTGSSRPPSTLFMRFASDGLRTASHRSAQRVLAPGRAAVAAAVRQPSLPPPSFLETAATTWRGLAGNNQHLELSAYDAIGAGAPLEASPAAKFAHGDGVGQVCSSRGMCLPTGVCQCLEGFQGRACELRVIQHGSCNFAGVCECGSVSLDDTPAFPGQRWRGAACDKRTCPSDCSGHGQCTNGGACQCDQGWTGASCNVKACPDACSHRGVCLPTGKCRCMPGFGGDACQKRTCPMTGSGQMCSGHGSCEPDTDVCECDDL